MRKLLLPATVLLSSCLVGNAQEKQPVHITIQAAPEQIKKTALGMLVRTGYSLDSANTSQLKISRPFTTDETEAYNTAHWTNPPISNCRHVQTFNLSAEDHAINVAMTSDAVCHADGEWRIFRRGDEKEIQSMKEVLEDLKARSEEASRGR